MMKTNLASLSRPQEDTMHIDKAARLLISTAFDADLLHESIPHVSRLKNANPLGYQKTDSSIILENLQKYLVDEINCATMLSLEEFTNDGAKWLYNNYRLNADNSYTSTLPGLTVTLRVDPFSKTVGKCMYSAYAENSTIPLKIQGNTLSHLRVSPASLAWKIKNELDALGLEQLDNDVLDPSAASTEKQVHAYILKYIEEHKVV